MRGHIRKRGERWSVVVELPRDIETGKRRQAWHSAPTRREAEQLLTRLLREIDTGSDLDPSRLTVGEYLEHWLTAVAKGRVGIRSYERYEQIVRLHLIPAFGTILLTKLQPAHLSRLYARLTAAGRAPRTVASVHVVLHSALKEAVKWQMLLRNVADVVAPPRARDTSPDLWDRATLARFLPCIKGQRFEAIYLVALNTGMRQGEILGLRWADVEIMGRSPSVAVRQQQLATRTQGRIASTPKGKRGRAIALTPATVAALVAHQERQAVARAAAGPAWQDHDLVFAAATGDWLPASTLDGDWRRGLRRWGLPHMKFHGLRHLHATYLLLQGVHPKIVSERLGHSTTAITMEIYSHVTPGLQEQAALAFDAAMRTLLEDPSAGDMEG